MTAMTTERLQDLAYEVALGYHPPADLAVRFDVPEQVIHELDAEPRFRAAVLEAQRTIDDGGDQLRMLARRLAGQLLPVMAGIVNDRTARHADRVSAFKALSEVGDLNKQSPATGGQNFAIQINLNPP